MVPIQRGQNKRRAKATGEQEDGSYTAAAGAGQSLRPPPHRHRRVGGSWVGQRAKSGGSCAFDTGRAGVAKTYRRPAGNEGRHAKGLHGYIHSRAAL